MSAARRHLATLLLGCALAVLGRACTPAPSPLVPVAVSPHVCGDTAPLYRTRP